MAFPPTDPTPLALCAIASVGAAVDELAAASTWMLSDDQSLDGWQQLEAIQRKLDAVSLAWLADIDHRGAATATGATSTARWVQAATGASPGRAWATARLADALDSRYRLLADALAAGLISREHAQVAARALDRLPASVSATELLEAEELLTAQAQKLDARQLATAGQQLRRHLDPDAEDRLFEAEQAARDSNWFAMYSDPDRHGGPVTGWLDAQSQDVLAAALRPLAAPRPQPDGTRDPRSARQRNGDALAELARQMCNSGQLPAEHGQAPHVMVMMRLETLEERIGAAHATLADGMAISAAEPTVVISSAPLRYACVVHSEARRIACDARLIPVVLGANGEPLDVGRASYPVTAAIRRGLIARDGGCVHIGCGRPVAWTDAHHIQRWSDGGPTSVTNCCLLCEAHHRLYHGGGWQIRMATDGHPEILAPPWHRDGGTWQPGWRRRPDGTIGAPP